MVPVRGRENRSDDEKKDANASQNQKDDSGCLDGFGIFGFGMAHKDIPRNAKHYRFSRVKCKNIDFTGLLCVLPKRKPVG